MATSPDAVRAQLAMVTAAATAEIATAAKSVTLERQMDAAITASGLIVPPYYDAAGTLAVAWYDELRDEARPQASYAPTIIGDPETDWIEREASKFQRALNADLEGEMARMVDEVAALAAKEVARGYRDSILGNTRTDAESIGWSRVARPGACKFCVMLAGKGSVYRAESSAIFAAHKGCNCAARPEFRGGDHGPEANVVQYVASSRRARDESVQAARNARVRKYLNKNYPEARG